MTTNSDQQASSTKQTKPTIEKAISSLQSHYASTGAYRAEDLRLVIGDQRIGVRYEVDDCFALCTRKHK